MSKKTTIGIVFMLALAHCWGQNSGLYLQISPFYFEKYRVSNFCIIPFYEHKNTQFSYLLLNDSTNEKYDSLSFWVSKGKNVVCIFRNDKIIWKNSKYANTSESDWFAPSENNPYNQILKLCLNPYFSHNILKNGNNLILLSKAGKDSLEFYFDKYKNVKLAVFNIYEPLDLDEESKIIYEKKRYVITCEYMDRLPNRIVIYCNDKYLYTILYKY